MYTVNCFKQSKQIEKFYDLYHKVYLDICGHYDNLAIHMGYYDYSIESHEESLLRLNEIVFDIAKNFKLIETVPDPLLKKARLEEKKGIY